jgi:hypothetical protein
MITLALGQTIRHVQIMERIGEGAMGEVFRAKICTLVVGRV